MNDLLEYLENDDLNIRWQYYESGTYNNMTHLMYGMLRSLVRLRADSLVFTSTECIWSKQGNVLHSFDLNTSFGSAYEIDALSVILTRDPIIQKHVHLVSQDENSAVYKIDLPPE